MGGCADIMAQSAISQIAPEWFEEKAVEVKGEGYPELADIPETRTVEGTPEQWQGMAASLKTEAARLEAHLDAAGVVRTDEEVRATAAQWRALVEEGSARLVPPAPVAPDKSGR
jgi:hypothetical protein